MAQVFFHYSTPRGVVMDRSGADIDGISDARARAVGMVRSLIATPTDEDWRGWILHASDEDGEEMFLLPFTSVLGMLH